MEPNPIFSFFFFRFWSSRSSSDCGVGPGDGCGGEKNKEKLSWGGIQGGVGVCRQGWGASVGRDARVCPSLTERTWACYRTLGPIQNCHEDVTKVKIKNRLEQRLAHNKHS